MIFFSSYEDFAYARSAIKYDVFDYLLKPVKYQELADCFERLKKVLDIEYAPREIPREAVLETKQNPIPKVLSYIDEHIADCSLEEASRTVYLSPKYLSVLFKENQGISFSDYVQNKKMKRACQLLKDPAIRQYQIASLIGYENPKNFSRAFKSYYGITPQEYRTLQTMDVSAGKFTEYRQVRFNQFDTREYISVYDKMPTTNGSFVVNINYQDFFDKLKNLPDKNEILFIINARGDTVIAVPKDGNLIGEALGALNGKLEKYGNQPLEARWIRLGQTLYCVSTIQDEEYGLTYLSMISSSSFLDRFMMIGIWIGMLLLVEILVIILICYLLTKESFSHINQVLKLFADAENGIYPGENKEAAEDEYDLVLMNVVKFFLNTTFLKSQLEQQKLKKESAEMAALQLQISPHFLFNTLQALNFEMQRQLGGYQQVNSVIDELSAILQFALKPANHLVTLEEELEKLKKYAGIQKFRFKDSLVFYCEVEEEAMGVYVPKMILQPLVENSISHGILPGKEMGYIKVRAFIRQEQLWVTVTDTGIGMSKEQIQQNYRNMADPESQNIGLANVNRRLVLNYGEAAALRIISRQGRGTCITFRIPLEPCVHIASV